MEDNSHWGGTEDTIDDPEEKKVICCALDSYLQYAKVAHFNVTHLRRQSFYALPQAQWQMLAKPPFHFLDTLDKTDDAIDANAELARAIASNGLRSFHMTGSGSGSSSEGTCTAGDDAEPVMPREWQGVAKHTDIDKARSTLRQFYRDWTAEGAAERAASFAPVFRAAEQQRERCQRPSPPDADSDAEADADADADGRLKVLVPGAGLGRLVFDLCRMGFDAEGNEISYHQLLASAYVLNCTQRAGQHTIYPWIHSFSNHLTRRNHLRGYAVPDLHPATELALTPAAGEMSMCAADFLCLYSDENHEALYDVVATVFFLDTAPNLIRYLEAIFHCLKPGGILVNVGPLLWHFENHAPGNHGRDDDGDGEHDYNNSSGIADPGSFELADDEVMALVETLGFVVESRETGVEAPYIQDADSMLRTIYRASTWVARKPAPS
ncbi:N2227-like protein [Sodiomyces alkalinus F11]|uniref:carnosine N-methyltransferase n=1 Tax=Sodiomyces alkalinus (strain CBS 110278 / VKM F-3762 / F11) TaxID=1314773 RepID=A0A3N2Q3D3_SODAK|nr:N2227-like protein [Sodiomyces alkalinus F11]ROT41252.1 N2227-like protein [Sodiomyces alkalinus F11]